MNAALHYLTGRPLGVGWASSWSVLAFPLVGAAVGAGWVVGSRILLLLPRTTAVAAAAILIIDALMTRALHLRGLTEAIDAVTVPDPAERQRLPARLSPTAALQPAVGAGVAALVLVVLLRFGVLFFAAEFDYRLLTVPLSGRAAMLWLLWRSCLTDPVDAPVPAALGRPSPLALGLAVVLSVLGALLAGTRGLWALGLAVAVGVAWDLWWRRRRGGRGALTGASMAAGGLVAETAALLTLGAV